MNATLAPRQRAKVLIVDDTPDNLLMRLLAAHDYTVLAANSGATAVQLMETNLPDIVFLKVTMPGMDGYEVCRRMKANQRIRAVPVIFVSATDTTWDKAKAFAVGAVDYVVQPIEAAEVLARLQTQLTLSSLRRQLEQRGQERTADLLKANEALRESQLLLKAIIDNSTAIIYVKDLDGCYLLVNNRFQELFGGANGDLRGLNDNDIFPPEIAHKLAEVDRHVIDTGAGIECEEVRFHRDVRHTYISVKSALRDLNGDIYAVCAIATDITERVRDEAILCELNDMLENRLSQRLPENESDAH